MHGTCMDLLCRTTGHGPDRSRAPAECCGWMYVLCCKMLQGPGCQSLRHRRWDRGQGARQQHDSHKQIRTSVSTGCLYSSTTTTVSDVHAREQWLGCRGRQCGAAMNAAGRIPTRPTTIVSTQQLLPPAACSRTMSALGSRSIDGPKLLEHQLSGRQSC